MRCLGPSILNILQIFYNRKLLTEFEHREALQSVNHVYVEGFIELHNVNFGGKFYVNFSFLYSHQIM